MSYILDALRKSEQQRQATQPDTVTERLLINPNQPAKFPFKWLIIIAITNVIAISAVGWFFLQKPTAETKKKPELSATSERTSIGAKSNQPKMPIVAENNSPAAPSTALRDDKSSGETSIAQMLEGKKEAAKTVESQRTSQPTPVQRPIIVKKEIKQPRKLGQKDVKQLQPTESPELATQNPAAELNDTLAETRNNQPKLNINVFSYAEKPEDRFVIIDMVKYKPGQLINGSAKLKEIRSDSIVLQDQNGTYTVDRP